MRDIIAGVVLIGIGLAGGGSVFTGEWTLFNIIFDGLGVLFIVRGLFKVVKSKQAA
jgi:hypothetical protein